MDEITRHEEGLKVIHAKGLDDIAQVILLVRQLYLIIYKEQPEAINCGQCEDFACDVLRCLWRKEDRTRTTWGDDMGAEAYWYGHCFIVHRGRYYDSEAPHGEDEWSDLPFFIREAGREEDYHPCQRVKATC